MKVVILLIFISPNFALSYEGLKTEGCLKLELACKTSFLICKKFGEKNKFAWKCKSMKIKCKFGKKNCDTYFKFDDWDSVKVLDSIQKPPKIKISKTRDDAYKILENPSVYDWKKASDESKIATCGAWLLATVWKGKNVEFHKYKIARQSIILKNSIDSIVKDLNDETYNRNNKVVYLAAILIQNSSDLGP